MSKRPTSTEISTLTAWLRNERRLGIRHCAVRAVGPLQRVCSDSADQAGQRGARQPEAGLAPDNPGLAPDEAGRRLSLLDTDSVKGCTKCGLHEQRTNTVFGVGNPRPDLVFVGEGPGADEDASGLPFVGRAGQLLTKMIGAMTLTREQVYICNIVKCRPPSNRTPSDDEMQACRPYLFAQLAILRPKIIVALGRPAAQTLLATRESLGRLRARFHDFPPPELSGHDLPPCKLMPTYHPAYLLRSPGEKPKAWDDLQQVMRYLSLPVPKR